MINDVYNSAIKLAGLTFIVYICISVSYASAIPSELDCIRLALPLYKISYASAISSELDCVRLALPLYKISYASAISSELDCVRLALSLQKDILTHNITERK